MGSWTLPPDLLGFQRGFAAALDKPAEGPMAVYRNTVLHGAVEALRANYPVVEQILGSVMFDGVAVDYARAFPPRRPVLALYGDGFADWLEERPWITHIPYVPDVARIERLRVECLFAADAEPVRPSGSAFAALCGLNLHLHPAVRFGWLSSPAMTIWLAHQQPLTCAIEPEWKAEGALFTRPDPFTVVPTMIDRAQHRLLFGIRVGESVGCALRAAAQLSPDCDASILFASLVNLGVFIAPAAERTSS